MGPSSHPAAGAVSELLDTYFNREDAPLKPPGCRRSRNAGPPPLDSEAARAMRAELLSIGTELLLGEIVDTNSAWLCGQLADAGYDVFWSQRVGDNVGRAVEALRKALERSEIVVTTGGLGSTDDDVTRDVVALALQETPFIDPLLEAHLREWFGRASVPFQDIILKQALRIPSAEALPNRVGTAPGWLVRVPASGRIIVTLPGPPRELEAMWSEQAAPRLPRPDACLLRHTFKTYGIGEGRVFEMLGDLVKNGNPSVATYFKRDGVHVRVAARAGDRSAAEAFARPTIERVRAILGPSTWGENEDTLVGRIAQELRQRGQHCSSIESITGGRIAAEITSVSGVSDVYTGGAVAYDPAVKVKMGVPEHIIASNGVVSAQTAVAMAQACASWFGTEYAVATTGVAGPSELEGKPPGTVHMAVRGPQGTEARLVTYAARSREQVQERATFAALFLLWQIVSASAR